MMSFALNIKGYFLHGVHKKGKWMDLPLGQKGTFEK